MLARRLQIVHAGLQGQGGFPPKVAAYLARKYGYSPEDAMGYGPRVADLLRRLAGRPQAQHASGSRYLIGHALTALDIYTATAMAMFSPLPEALCEMDPITRTVFETLDATTRAALAPPLRAHRAMVYAEHLATPLSL